MNGRSRFPHGFTNCSVAALVVNASPAIQAGFERRRI